MPRLLELHVGDDGSGPCGRAYEVEDPRPRQLGVCQITGSDAQARGKILKPAHGSVRERRRLPTAGWLTLCAPRCTHSMHEWFRGLDRHGKATCPHRTYLEPPEYAPESRAPCL